MLKKVLSETEYFSGMDEKEIECAYKFFDAKEVTFKKGEVLNTITKPLSHFGIVIEGQVQVYLDDIDGNQIIMASVGPGDSFGESLCYLKIDSPVYIMALSDGSYLKMSTEKIDRVCQNGLDIEFRKRFIANLASRTLQMNNRIQILSKISIRDKLLTFFAECSKCGTKQEIELPFNRNDMAIYLGVNRSALSRELSAMQEEGLIEFRKNKFKLLKM